MVFLDHSQIIEKIDFPWVLSRKGTAWVCLDRKWHCFRDFVHAFGQPVVCLSCVISQESHQCAT